MGRIASKNRYPRKPPSIRSGNPQKIVALTAEEGDFKNIRMLPAAFSLCFFPQPPVPGMDESLAYQASPQQLPAAQPPQPSNPQHGTHGLSNGPQPGTAPATQHSQTGAPTGQTYGPHNYSEPAKPKKGQQLWTRMKRELADLGVRKLEPICEPPRVAGPLSGCCDRL